MNSEKIVLLTGTNARSSKHWTKSYGDLPKIGQEYIKTVSKH